MHYSAVGSNVFMSWSQAAMLGGLANGSNVTGKPRSYAVSAWLKTIESGFTNVTDALLSNLSEDVRRAWLLEFDLPLTKRLIYKDENDNVRRVMDATIRDVWNGWCVLRLFLEDGETLDIDSMYFSELNKGASFPNTFVVFDLETTGKNPKTAEICEIAAIKVSDGNFSKAERFKQFVYIDGSMPIDAEEIHHISRKMLLNSPHMTSCLKTFIDFVGDDAVLVGHNIKGYDIPLLERVANDCGVTFTFDWAIDTLEIAKRQWPGLQSYSMDVLRPALGLDSTGAHRALKDCEDELSVYLALRKNALTGEPTEFVIDPNMIQRKTPPKRATSRPKKTGSTTRQWGKGRKAKSFVPSTTDFDANHALYQRHVVLTGDMPFGDRDYVMQKICDVGGIPQDNVTKKTDYVVVGENPGRGKISKAEEYRQKYNLPIRTITSDEFKLLLGNEA